MSRSRAFIRDRAYSVASRAGGYLRSGPGGVNLEKVFVYVAIAAGGYVLYKILQGLRGIGEGYDKAADAAANAYVDATHPGVKLAGDIVFILPNGARITAKQVTPAAGGTFIYAGQKYRLVAATPPGSGVYTAAKA